MPHPEASGARPARKPPLRHHGAMLSLANVRVEIGDRVLLDKGNVLIKQGEKVALVGRNGVGKTTLLRTIAGERERASGEIRLPQRTAYLRQEGNAPGRSEATNMVALDYLIAASPLHNMKEQLEAATAAMHSLTGDALDAAVHEFGELHERFTHEGGYELETQAERIAAGLGIDEEMLLTPVSGLSGGQRRRLDLAALLLAGGDLFILDEPTNHLDVDAKRWLIGFLRDTPSTVLLVSHDIKLMDNSIDRVLALDNARMDSYAGTYSDFLRQRAEDEAQRKHAARNISKETHRLEETKKMFAGANATHAKKRRALQRRIDSLNERLKEHAPPVRQRQLSFRLPTPARAGDIVLEATGLAKSYDGVQVFKGIDLHLQRQDAFLLVGVNGAGKTTMLRCLAGREKLDEGTARRGANVTVGYYAQEHEDIDGSISAIANMRRASPELSETEMRSILGHFNISGDAADHPARTLSGGEKTKLALASLMASKANLLLLDEPTNNLDPQSVEALLSALQNYEGTMVVVSHDADFVSQLAPERAYLLPQGRIVYFDEKVMELIPAR
jgi:ATPase subunit of ABC transporter with duplicated ATPase domains